MKIDRDEYEPFLRQDFVAFTEKAFGDLNPGAEYFSNFHVEVISEALQQCFAGKLRRLAINLPPRSLKSHMVSVSFPAWLLGRRPSAQIICASYTQDLSEKLALDCRTIMTTDWYRNLFPCTRLAADRQPVHDFTTTQRGFSFGNLGRRCFNR
jgi:hypothetical protein